MAAADRARWRLVDALCAAGRVRTPAVEDAFRAVPRHRFLPGIPLDEAYADHAVAVQRVGGLPTSSASQPSMMAIMLEQLDLRSGHRVLEVGAGTGYNAALMARIVGPASAVTAVDIDADLVAAAVKNLTTTGTTGVELLCADGAFGHPPGAPYDRIVLTVGSVDIRSEWVDQLVPDGRLLLPLAVRGSQLSVALDLGADGLLRSDSVRSCAFIRLRGVGAVAEPRVPLTEDGIAIRLSDDTRTPVAPDAVLTALGAPGPARPTGINVGPADVWDGLGLWIALAEPAVFRLLLTGRAARSPLAAELFALGPDRGTVALAAGGGLAALVVEPESAGWVGPLGVRSFGADVLAADRMVALVEGWVVAGRPSAADLRFVVIPHTVAAGPVPPGVTVIDKGHVRLLVSWAGQECGRQP